MDPKKPGKESMWESYLEVILCCFAHFFFLSNAQLSPSWLYPFGYLVMSLSSSTTPFTSFHDFMDVISPGRESASVAMGRMEVVARELSTDGMYVSRSLAFNDTEFATKYVDIPYKESCDYDLATEFWTRLIKFLDATVECLYKHDPNNDHGASDSKKYLNAIVWGCHQRFFKR